jgi:hypothetical protein
MFRLFYLYLDNGESFCFRSAKMLKKWLGRCGLKLCFTLPKRAWIIYYPDLYTTVGFMEINKPDILNELAREWRKKAQDTFRKSNTCLSAGLAGIANGLIEHADKLASIAQAQDNVCMEFYLASVELSMRKGE